MSLLGLRTLLPWLALATGTLLGVRGLPAHASPITPSEIGKAPDNVDPPPPVDAAQLPDPGPWPMLNPECNLGRAWLLAEGPTHDPHDGRRFVTFTFDDGPRPETTPEILRLLRHDHVHATFFFIGRYLEGDKPRAVESRAILKDVLADGHLVGSHTEDHDRLTSLAPSQALAQIDDGIDAIAHVTSKAPTLFRPPYGDLDVFTESHLKTRGQQLVMWSVEASDMKSSDADAMTESLEDQLDFKGGGVILLHDVRRSTVTVLKNLLEWLHARRFDPKRPERPGFVVTDLLTYQRETAAHPQPYSDRTALESARASRWRAEHPDTRAPQDVMDETNPY